MVIDKRVRSFASVKSENSKLHLLLSSKDIEVNVEGLIEFDQKLDDGAKGQSVKFWIHPAKVKFDPDREIFQVIDVSNFLAYDF